MATFSERYGYKPVRSALGQYECMDEELRVAIWNFFKQEGTIQSHDSAIAHDFLRIPIGDDLSMILNKDDVIRKRFFKLKWNEVYDYVEFCMSIGKSKLAGRYERNQFQKYVNKFNAMLNREGSAYRLLEDTIVPIIDEREILEVEQASESSEHIRKAVELLANREKPDSENVIKESISAVEYAVRKATDLDIVKGLEKLAIHSQLAQAWKNMYHWSSDEPGVRHAKPEPSEVGMAEARYVLIAASAFVNYLKFKGHPS